MPKRSCISIHPGGLGVGEGISPAAGASDQQVTQFYHTKDYPLKSSIVKPRFIKIYEAIIGCKSTVWSILHKGTMI